jgi:sulfur transfer complex TusBCD TusB component (DsrH family)
MATLHILRNLDTKLAEEAVDASDGDQLLLIQDAVLHPGPFPCSVTVCRDDLSARNIVSTYPSVDYDGIRDLMLAHERVVLW